jgi:5,5'-dehydrodivanillate O-demethylase oxygenase subunit
MKNGNGASGNLVEQATENWKDFQHTGPGTLAGAYLRRFWQPVYVSARLQTSIPVSLRIMDEELTLFRGSSGTPYLVQARCPHRGMLLHVGWVAEDTIRCFFHGWRYEGSSGQCVEQPGEDEAFKAKIRLRTYPLVEYLGLIFAYLGEGEPPPLPRYPDFETGGFNEVRTYEVSCNYFQHIEDNPVHSLFVHGARRGVPKPPPRVWVEETAWGHATFAEYPGYPGVRAHHRGMPNISHVVNQSRDGTPDQPHLSWTVPVDDEHLVNFGVSLVPLEGEEAERYKARRVEWSAHGGRTYDESLVHAVLEGRMRIEDVRQRTDVDIGRIEDGISYLGIRPIADHASEHLGRTDVSTTMFRKIWVRELRNLVEGKPLKEWRRTESCVATPQTVPMLPA